MPDDALHRNRRSHVSRHKYGPCQHCRVELVGTLSHESSPMHSDTFRSRCANGETWAWPRSAKRRTK